MTIWVCLCAFSLASSPQFTVAAFAESTQEESSSPEDGEGAEEELEAVSSGRRSIKKRRSLFVSKPYGISRQHNVVASLASYLPAITGHQLANGVCVPMLV
ncbi:MAG: hypothetical protein JKY95_09805 [Planctomycetaceae bacterium]|nr:hypothetical protein [Planctomycetaceae bacterium]